MFLVLLKMDESLIEPLKKYFSLAKRIGLYQNGEQSRKYLIRGILTWFLSVGIISIRSVMSLFESTSIKEFVAQLTMFLPLLLFVIKLASFLKQLKSLEELHAEVEKIFEISFDERFKDRKFIKRRLDFITKLAKIYINNGYIVGVLIVIAILVLKRIPFNVYGDVSYEENKIGFVLASINLMCSSALGNFAISILNIMPLVFLSYAVGFMDELSKRLEFIGLSEDFDYEELVECIRIHVKVKEIVDQIQENFKMSWLCQAVSSSMVICLSVFTMTSSTGLYEYTKALSFAVLLTLEIFLPCYIGQELIEASMNLTDAIGHSNWCSGTMSKKTKKTIVIFMENLKEPMRISFFNLINIDLMTFRNIVDSAYSLYAILTNFAN